MELDARFVDVEFPACREYAFGHVVPPPPEFKLFAGIPIFEEAVTPIPSSQWKELSEEIENRKAGSEWYINRVYNQRQEGCHDEKTEVLTERGWTPWPDYNWRDRLATVNPLTSTLEFQDPIEKHVYDYDGELYVSDHSRVDFAVTPSHRMYVRKWDERQRALDSSYQFVTADSLGWYSGLMPAPRCYVGLELAKIIVDGDREYDGDDFISLMAAIVSDGWAGGTENTKSRVSFCCFRPDRQPMLRELAARVGFREQPSRPGVWYRQDAWALAHWLRSNVYSGEGCGAVNKRCPLIVKSASQRQVGLFFRYFGDQSHTRECGAQFYTSSKGLADDLQELSLHIGKRASINKREPRTACIGGRDVTDRGGYVVTQWGCDNLTLNRKRQVARERYKGPVFCATVPNGTIVTRRNKSILISGNSCVGNAGGQGIEVTQARQFGKSSVVPLSAVSLYQLIGRSANSGATIPDCLEALKDKGVIPLDTPENRAKFGDVVMPHTGFSTRRPQGWEEVAANFRVQEFFSIRTLDGIVTAGLLGIPVVVGRQGHSILYLRPFYKDGKLYYLYVNSWGQWGMAAADFAAGFGADSERLIRESAKWAFAIRTSVTPSWLEL